MSGELACVWPLDSRPPPRHGVSGGSHGRPESGPLGSRRRPWSHHYLLLKKKNENASFAYRTLHSLAHVAMDSGQRAFLVLDEICFGFFFILVCFSVVQFFWRRGLSGKRDHLWLTHEGPWNEGKQVGWARSHRATVSPHLLHMADNRT